MRSVTRTRIGRQRPGVGGLGQRQIIRRDVVGHGVAAGVARGAATRPVFHWSCRGTPAAGGIRSGPCTWQQPILSRRRQGTRLASMSISMSISMTRAGSTRLPAAVVGNTRQFLSVRARHAPEPAHALGATDPRRPVDTGPLLAGGDVRDCHRHALSRTPTSARRSELWRVRPEENHPSAARAARSSY